MKPRFTRYPPWAARTLLLAGIACLPLAGLISHEVRLQHQLAQHTRQAQQQLQIQQKQLREFQDAQRRRLQQQRTVNTPQPVIMMLDSIATWLTPDIAVAASNVDGQGRRVHLEVHAKSLNALLAFIQRLEGLPATVGLDHHRQSTDKDPDWPVYAAIDIQFGPEGKP